MTRGPLRLVSGGVAARPAVSENGVYVDYALRSVDYAPFYGLCLDLAAQRGARAARGFPRLVMISFCLRETLLSTLGALIPAR